MHLPVVGEIGAGQAKLMALSPGTAVKIMTGAPMPTGADTVVPYEWTDRGVARVVIGQAPVARPARPPCRRGRRRGRRAHRARHRPRPAPSRPARGGRPVRRTLAAATPRRGHLHRLRAARARHPAGPRLDLRRQLLPAVRGRASRRRDRLPRRHRARRPAGLHRRPHRPARARRPRRHLRRGQRGRLRRRQGGAVVARHRVVRWRRDAARQAAGLRRRRRRQRRRSSRCRATRSPRTSRSRRSCCPPCAG